MTSSFYSSKFQQLKVQARLSRLGGAIPYFRQVPVGTADRAFKSLPEGFRLAPSGIPNSGYGVFSDNSIPDNTWLGQIDGVVVTDEEYADDPDTFSDDYMWPVSTAFL